MFRNIGQNFCCNPPSRNVSGHINSVPSRMISAAQLPYDMDNASRQITGVGKDSKLNELSQGNNANKLKQTFIYGGSETLEAEDCGWLEPIRLKVHALEIQQYINPNKIDALPNFVYNVDHIKDCVERPDNWAPDIATGVGAMTFHQLNTIPPEINHPLRLTSDNSQVGTNNPYIQQIPYTVARIADIPYHPNTSRNLDENGCLDVAALCMPSATGRTSARNSMGSLPHLPELAHRFT